MRKCFMSGLGPAGRSAPHADAPGVSAEHTLPPAHHTRVRALVDGVGDDAQVRLAQRQVARVGELQGFLVLVPAAGRVAGLGRVPSPRCPPSGGHGAGPLTTLCLSCGGSSGHSGRSHSGPQAPAWSWSWVVVQWRPPWGRETLPGSGRGRGQRGPHQCVPPPRQSHAPRPEWGPGLTVAEVAAAGAEPLHKPPAGVTEAPPSPGRAHEQPVQAACRRASWP